MTMCFAKHSALEIGVWLSSGIRTVAKIMLLLSYEILIQDQTIFSSYPTHNLPPDFSSCSWTVCFAKHYVFLVWRCRLCIVSIQCQEIFPPHSLSRCYTTELFISFGTVYPFISFGTGYPFFVSLWAHISWRILNPDPVPDPYSNPDQLRVYLLYWQGGSTHVTPCSGLNPEFQAFWDWALFPLQRP
jgi:hypothetical protein